MGKVVNSSLTVQIWSVRFAAIAGVLDNHFLGSIFSTSRCKLLWGVPSCNRHLPKLPLSDRHWYPLRKPGSCELDGYWITYWSGCYTCNNIPISFGGCTSEFLLTLMWLMSWFIIRITCFVSSLIGQGIRTRFVDGIKFQAPIPSDFRDFRTELTPKTALRHQ